jgi:hypothetical protein
VFVAPTVISTVPSARTVTLDLYEGFEVGLGVAHRST